jgi:phage FluMu gp28-like protein
MIAESKYFLPYQLRWLADDSPVKIWEKSRRIGATYVQSYEDVRDLLKHKYDVWFSSADESAAREYIIYAEKWARLFQAAAQYLGYTVVDKDKDIKAFVIEFANGKRLNALSSSPKRFRSKGGKVVLDEFAWHDDQDGMWAAAEPTTTWGFPLRILSTHNGQSCLYYQFVRDCKAKKLDWSLHQTTLIRAVDEGLLDRIMKRTTTQAERQAWLDEKRRRARGENRWLQEYCCVAVDEATALLPYEMIARCERQGLLGMEISNGLYVGMDIGRRRDLSVIWGLEKMGLNLYARIYQVIEKAPFRAQRDALFGILRHPKLRRACIDATGIGMQLAEEAQEKFGRIRIEAITFTSAVKEELASGMLPWFEDQAIYIPEDPAIREDLHIVRKTVTAAGNVRYDVQKNEETDSHADRFWSLALAMHAAGDKNSGPFVVATRGSRETKAMIKGY